MLDTPVNGEQPKTKQETEMITPEKKVKLKVVAVLKELGAYYFYPVSGGYGASGVPDIVGCYKGNFFAVECKAGKGKTTALQEKNLNNIMTAGGTALVVNEDNIEDVHNMLISMDSVEFERTWLKATVQDTVKELIEARRLTNEVLKRSKG
jgi:Holliday junction resolvase